jgi:fructose/tagatose bisphosphate aldolase
MPLESVPARMGRAREGGYAVGYFESWNLESLCGVIEAAEHARAPVVIGFNREFLDVARVVEAARDLCQCQGS